MNLLLQHLILDGIYHQNEEVTSRICQNVQEFIVINNIQETPVHSTFENTTTVQLIRNLVGGLVPAADSAIRDLDPTAKLTFLRIQTKKYELLVAPEEEFTIIVQQN